MFLLAMLLAGARFNLGAWYFIGLIAAAGLFVQQTRLTRSRTPDDCFRAFLSNHQVGAAIFAGIFLHYLFAA